MLYIRWKQSMNNLTCAKNRPNKDYLYIKTAIFMSNDVFSRAIYTANKDFLSTETTSSVLRMVFIHRSDMYKYLKRDNVFL